MTGDERAYDEYAELRRRAEELAREDEASTIEELDSLSPEEAKRVIHELRVHQIELEIQNEELRRAQEALEAARARYLDLYDLAPVGYLSLSEKGLILEANFTAAALLGAARGSLVGQPFSRFIKKEDQDIYYLHRKKLFKEDEPLSCELRMVKKDGTAFWAGLESAIAEGAEGERLCREIVFDISERRRVEEALQKSFYENKCLLAELQHRVKNSFNIISGMIELASTLGDSSAEGKTLLGDLASRVRSISELYSLLYSSGTFAEVRLDEYCARVVAPLVHLSANIVLDSELESITVPVKAAAPLGLILTELITNALKYAFPGGRSGTIAIRLRKCPSGVLLEVEDDGAGMPSDFDLSGNTGMGLNLVRALAGQIYGKFSIERGAGTRCIVEFPIEVKA